MLRAIELAWPGGAALTPFTEHPVDAVRRGAIGPAVASGHPRALGQLKGLAKEPDPQLAAAARAALESVRRMPPPLIFRLLGGFEARRGTWRIEPADWGRPMTARLVRFLLVHRDRVVPEDVLFEAFWPGKAAPAARHNLQVAASMARGVLDPGLGGESVIEAVERGYRLRLADHDLVDAEEFELAARAALAEPRLVARRRLLDRAARLWGGEPLPEDGYMDWSLDWRRQLNELYASVLEALVAAGRDSGDMRATIEAGHAAARARPPQRDRPPRAHGRLRALGPGRRRAAPVPPVPPGARRRAGGGAEPRHLADAGPDPGRGVRLRAKQRA